MKKPRIITETHGHHSHVWPRMNTDEVPSHNSSRVLHKREHEDEILSVLRLMGHSRQLFHNTVVHWETAPPY